MSKLPKIVRKPIIVAGLAFATIIGQTIAVLARLKTTTERLEKQVEKQVEKQGELFVHALEGVLKVIERVPGWRQAS